MVDRVEYLSSYTGLEHDDAAAKRHEHSDLTALNKFSEDIAGDPTWNNNLWPVVPLSLGVSVLPTIAYTSPNITVSGGEYCIYNTIDFSGKLFHVGSIPQATFEITNEDVVYHLYVLNTNGVGSFGVTTNADILLDGRYVTIARIIRTGTFFHTFLYDTLCLGYNSKLQTVMEQVFGFQKMSGLGIAVAGIRNLVVDAGRVAYGAVINNVTTINSATGDNLIFVYKDINGQWQTSLITQLNNTQYQTPTGLASLTSINNSVNWVWRGIEEQKHIYILLGEGNYNETEALESSPPTPPTWVTDHSILIGRVLFVRDSDVPSHVENIESVGYGSSGSISHDDTANKSGVGPEYYHLSSDQYSGLTAGTNTTLHRHANATTEVDGYLSAADKIKINSMIEEAPQDGYAYVRVNGAWERLTWGTE